jgi:hypothetical protein
MMVGQSDLKHRATNREIRLRIRNTGKGKEGTYETYKR